MSEGQLFNEIMRKLILYAAPVVFACICASATAGPAQDRHGIDFDSVQYIEMAQNDKEDKGFRLSDSQARELTKRWNQARPIGLCKFHARYIIIVHGKGGETRIIRATEDTMKEGSDYCFVTGDRYIETVWKLNTD